VKNTGVRSQEGRKGERNKERNFTADYTDYTDKKEGRRGRGRGRIQESEWRGRKKNCSSRLLLLPS